MRFIASFLMLVLCSQLNCYKALALQKPKIIGVIGTNEQDTKAYSNVTAYPFYWVRQNYLNNFANACAGQNVVFVMLPLDMEQTKKLSHSIDALVLTGGSESLYQSHRSDFETKMLDEIIKQKKQVLGICRGFQMLNYYFTKNEINEKQILENENLLKIKEHFNGKTIHKDNDNKLSQFFPLHKVKLDKKSKLAKILNKTEIDVNSSHNYALNKIGKKVLLYGLSPDDGVPEMIEIKDYPKFLVGVQWHPEFLSTDDDVKLLQAFCKAVVNNK